MAEPSAFVLEAFALLAYLQDEPAAARVEQVLEQAGKGKCCLFVSIINLGELLYIVERRAGISKAQEAMALIQQLPIEILAADEPAVFSAAHIKAKHALSYADACAVAAALHENAYILTGDAEFKDVEQMVKVEWLVK